MNDPKTRNEMSQLLDSLDNTPTSTPVESFEQGILRPGDRIHFFVSTSLITREAASGIGGGVTVERGATVTITDEILRLNVDREGFSWLTLVDDPEAQQKKWRRQVLARGPWPEDLPVIEPGTPEAKWALQRAVEAAKQLPPAEARVARQKAYEAYGKPDGVTALGSIYGGGAR